jgi:hypothetical protein
MSNVKVYYCKQTESPGSTNRISPAPSITINPEIYYSNDNVIGYTYIVTLNGYANALRKDLSESSVDFGVDKTIDHIGYLREVFNFNGGNLYIQKNNTTILVAKGATIQQLSFNESDNRWVNYSPFTIQLAFNEIDLPGCSNNAAIGCNSSIFHAGQSKTVTADNLVDITKYKIKEFSDKWSFTIDNTIYSDPINSLFKISYTLSATGQNYYVNDNLVPAWQQAKMFVQDRLYDQVKSLVGSILEINPNDSEDGCGPDKTLEDLHTAEGSDGLLDQFILLNAECETTPPNYGIFNETISCDTSESDGTFSITYNATLKNIDPLLSSVENAVIHTTTHNLVVSEGPPNNSTINVQGNIQGLVRGGFIYHNNDFTLPKNGLFISTVDSAETKYSNALSYYNTVVGDTSDLFDSFKEKINVKKSQLSMKGQDGYPKVASFSLDHNYHDGSISYSATYDRQISENLNRGFFNISVVRNDPIEIVQQFIIPGRANGPIIQKLGMKTQGTISINIEGSHPDNINCLDLSDVCNSIPVYDIPNLNSLLQDSSSSWIKSKEDYTMNQIDGSFSIALEYMCKG